MHLKSLTDEIFPNYLAKSLTLLFRSLALRKTECASEDVWKGNHDADIFPLDA